MKPSMFNIAQLYNDNILLYNTYSTSLVEIEPAIYNRIFIDGNYSDHKDEIDALFELGFLVENDCDELSEQELLRKTVIENNSDKIANIIIAPTMECNAHCYYCFEKGFRKGIMTRETADCLIQYLFEHWNHDELGITWFGGEPLIVTDIIDYIVDGLIKRGINFSSKITTNGSLLTESVIEKIKSKWNVEKIQITVDSIGEDYNKIKNYSDLKNPFEIVMQNIELALLNDLQIKVRINFDPEKKQTVVNTFNYLKDRFKTYDNLSIYFAPIDEDSSIVKNINQNFTEMNEHPYISLIKFGRENKLFRGFPDVENDINKNTSPRIALLKKLKIFPSPTNCYATCPSVYSIDSNGNIYKCHRTLGRKEFASGDIFNGIKKNSEYEFFCNTDLAYDECKECAVLPICQGGCKINGRIFSGKEACAPCKMIINNLILLYKQDLEVLYERR